MAVVAGIDEAGYGPLLGPLVVSAVAFDVGSHLHFAQGGHVPNEDVTPAGPLGPDGLARLLADHGPAGTPDATTLCVHSDYWRTTACLQWFPRSRRLRASYSTACAAAFREFA